MTTIRRLDLRHARTFTRDCTSASEGGFTPRRRHAGPATLSERHERRPRSKDRNTNRWSKDGSRLPERERQDGPGGATSTTTGMGQPKMPRGAAAGGAAAGAEERRATPPRRQQVQRHRQAGEDNDNATYAHSACKRTTSGHGRTSEGRGHGTRPSPPARGGRTTKRERQRQRAVRRQRSGSGAQERRQSGRRNGNGGHGHGARSASPTARRRTTTATTRGSTTKVDGTPLLRQAAVGAATEGAGAGTRMPQARH